MTETPLTPAPQESAASQQAAAEPLEEVHTVTETEQQVQLVRQVRYGRLMLVGAVLGALLAALATLIHPIAQGALYTMGQIVGFMALLGGIIGLALGALLGLLLGLAAKRRKGTGVAIQTDVR